MDWACNSGGASRNGENVLSEYLEGGNEVLARSRLRRTVILRLMLKMQLREQSVRF